MKKLLDSRQAKELDRYSIQEFGMESLILMERAALAAAGELAWRRGNYDQAIGLLEKALMVTQSRFGESDACAVIRQNLEMIKKEKEEKGITGAADKKEDKGGNPSHCASCQFKDAKF